MYEDYDLSELHDDATPVKVFIDPKTLPVPVGKVVSLNYLLSREWSLSRIDTLVRNNSLTYLPGRNSYIANKELY